MLVIRLLRTGKKNQPSFRIVVVEKERSSTSGRYTEEVGFYNPLTKEKILKGERIKYWISVGAQPSDTIHNMLVSEKIIEGAKIDLHKKSKKKEESAEALAKESAPEAAKTEEKKEEPKEETKAEPAEEKKEESPEEKKE